MIFCDRLYLDENNIFNEQKQQRSNVCVVCNAAPRQKATGGRERRQGRVVWRAAAGSMIMHHQYFITLFCLH